MHPIKSEPTNMSYSTENDRVQIIKNVFPSNADEVPLEMEFEGQRGHKRCVSFQYMVNIAQTFEVLQKSKVCFHLQGKSRSSLSDRTDQQEK